MIEMTLQLPNYLATKIQPISNWLPTIIELSLSNFTSLQVKKASDDLIAFLSSNPTVQKVSQYKISDRSQKRVSFLLENSGDGTIKVSESNELDEWSAFNNICVRLSVQALKLAE